MGPERTHIDVERLWTKVRKLDGGCWEWLAYRNADGYGQFHVRRVPYLAHRVVWTLLVGPIPEGMQLDHDGPSGCHNRGCVNPAHLEVTTHLLNSSRQVSANGSKSHCPRGHVYTSANTTIRRNGQRICTTCERARSARRSAEAKRRRAAA